MHSYHFEVETRKRSALTKVFREFRPGACCVARGETSPNLCPNSPSRSRSFQSRTLFQDLVQTRSCVQSLDRPDGMCRQPSGPSICLFSESPSGINVMMMCTPPARAVEEVSKSINNNEHYRQATTLTAIRPFFTRPWSRQTKSVPRP